MEITAKVTSFFFDRAAVRDALGRAAAAALGKAGAFIRRRARSSIRKRKRASRPGEPPSSHVGTLRNQLYFAFDAGTRSVVVGPVLLNTTKGVNVPRLLEFGGEVKSFPNLRRRIRKVGDGGEIRLYGRPCSTTKTAQMASQYKTLRGYEVPVTYCTLQTANQVARANKLNEYLYGPLNLHGVTIAPRPYMKPALAAEMPGIAKHWKDAFKR